MESFCSAPWNLNTCHHRCFLAPFIVHRLIVAWWLLVGKPGSDQSRKEHQYEKGGPRLVLKDFHQGVVSAPVFGLKTPGVPVVYVFPFSLLTWANIRSLQVY